MVMITTKYRPLVAIPEFGPDAVCADDVHAALLAWRLDVIAIGGTLHANSLTRTCAQQQVLLNKYNAWLAAGKPAKFDPAVMSSAATCQPGRSNHQGGRAIDVNTFHCFPGKPDDQQVDLLWLTGKPHGFTPIIATPDENESERWHFDFWGAWKRVHDQKGYDLGCLCSALDVGQAGQWQSDAALVQALCLYLGLDIGKPDGDIGPKTKGALSKLQIPYTPGADLEPVILALRAKPIRADWTAV